MDERFLKNQIYYQHTDGQNNYRKHAHWLEESSPKFYTFTLNRSRENQFATKRFIRTNGHLEL